MSYWQDRQLERFERSEKLMEDYYRELEQAFEQAQKEVSGVIYRFYERYAKDNKISLADAKRALGPSELRKFKGSLKEFEQLARESIGTYNLELENLSTKSRITRYEALQAEIKATLNKLYDRDFEQGAGKAMQSVYTDAYSRLNFDLDRYTGLHHNFAGVNTGTVETLLKYPFNGLDFSERIWRQNADLEYKIKQALTTAFVQGKNPFELSKEFAKTFDVKRREAYRLLNTEAAFVQGQATVDGYKEMGVDKYEICATLDSHTSQICRDQDGKVYEVAKMTVGVNYPPYHPNCRTTTVPVIGESNRTNDTRVARDPKTGKVVKVPANMTYREWKAALVEKHGETELDTLERMKRNESKDFAQYQKYRTILKEDSPNSFANFQELKYNKPEDWERIKGYAAYREKHSEALIQHYDIYHELRAKGFKPGVVLPPQKMSSYILADHGSRDPYHIMKRMVERNITDDEVHSFVNDALVMVNQWKETRKVFYSVNGVTVITKAADDWIAKTVWSKADFDEQTQTILEVIMKHVKGKS